MQGIAVGNNQNCKNFSAIWGESWEMEFDGNFNSCYQATFPGYTQTWMELRREFSPTPARRWIMKSPATRSNEDVI